MKTRNLSSWWSRNVRRRSSLSVEHSFSKSRRHRLSSRFCRSTGWNFDCSTQVSGVGYHHSATGGLVDSNNNFVALLTFSGRKDTSVCCSYNRGYTWCACSPVGILNETTIIPLPQINVWSFGLLTLNVVRPCWSWLCSGATVGFVFQERVGVVPWLTVEVSLSVAAMTGTIKFWNGPITTSWLGVGSNAPPSVFLKL